MPAPRPADPATPWRCVAAAGALGLFLGVAFPFVRVDSLGTWTSRMRAALSGGWVDLQTPLTAAAFGTAAAAAVYAFPRVRPGWLLLAGAAFGILNEAWQAAFLARHPQLGDAAAAVLGVAVGTGLARRLPRLAPLGRPAAGVLAVVLTLVFVAVLALAVRQSHSRTQRFGFEPPDHFLVHRAERHGGGIRAHRWRVSVPFHTPERAFYRPDGRGGIPLGVSMTLTAGLAAAGLGRTPLGRGRWALAAGAAPLALVTASILLFQTPWQGIPTGLTLGSLLASALAGPLPLLAWRRLRREPRTAG
ncbi:hypothetical protein [Phycisphaera mikurensis]|uniref:Uncharacterized protein n=1 Tax=Phycisphaera mikurensis (strain NBRC 102666 / KCTC 22515 / FYK2301M01) TaxID=1142394 RepID=I0IB24_PHYMF|nr:hypothetical protein [Phycisphaera mikurensis]MBB6442567.1 hypothetical protein [Phycisphaera mikurensis]BAM02462.1 hypothetical protein PSMK_03030 [Phycisphaera mikurensis NBRC 102666]